MIKKKGCFIVFAIALMLLFVSCKDEESNPLKGSWVGSNGITYTFADSTLVMEETDAGTGSSYAVNGTYTYNDTQITMTVTIQEIVISHIYSYTITKNGSVTTLTLSDDTNGSIECIKQ